MILPRYHIATSTIPGAGQGLFVDESVAPGEIITAPDAITQTYSFAELMATPELRAQLQSSARWFGDHYTLSPEWPDECYVNHSFTPSGLWHLGFLFATVALPAGSEITVDYRHLLAPGQAEEFADSATGQAIVGYAWRESITRSTQALAGLLRQGDG